MNLLFGILSTFRQKNEKVNLKRAFLQENSVRKHDRVCSYAKDDIARFFNCLFMYKDRLFKYETKAIEIKDGLCLDFPL